MTMPPDPPADDAEDVPPEELEEELEEEAEPEAEPGEPEEPEPESKPRGVPDREQRDRRVARETKLKEERDYWRAQVEQRNRQTAEEQQARDNKELEDARLQGPEAYAQTLYNRARREFATTQYQTNRQHNDMLDQLRFERMLAENSNLKNVAAEVEDMHRQLLATDPNYHPNRQAIAKMVLGERILKEAPKYAGQQRRRAQEGVKRETTRPPSNPSSQAGNTGRRRQPKDFYDRSLAEIEADLAKIPFKR